MNETMYNPVSGENRPPANYETHDFYAACFLRCIGYDLAGVRREGRRVFFVFEDRPERPRDVMAFFSDKAVVKPLRFASTIKDMKALLHST
jgi:hypothetical protein